MKEEWLRERCAEYNQRVLSIINHVPTAVLHKVMPIVSELQRNWLSECIAMATSDLLEEKAALQARLEAAEEKLESLNVFRNR